MVGERTFMRMSGVTWSVILAIAFAVLVVWVFRSLLNNKDASGTRTSEADAFFLLNSSYFLALLILAVLYMGNFYGVKDKIPWLVAGILPLGVAWFGAIGAIMSAYEGVFWQSLQGKWQSSWNYWHIVYPFIGAIYAIIGYFIFLVLFNTATTGTNAENGFVTPTLQTPVINVLIYYVLAFLIGFRQQYFSQLINRIAGLIFTSDQAQVNSQSADVGSVVPATQEASGRNAEGTAPAEQDVTPVDQAVVAPQEPLPGVQEGSAVDQPGPTPGEPPLEQP